MKVRKKVGTAAACGFALACAGALMLHAANAPTPKGYLVGEVDVRDAEAYRDYAAQTPALIAKHGGTYRVRGGATIAMEGTPPAGRIVVIEFASAAAARGFLESPEYRAIAPIRQKASSSRFFIVEGVPPMP